MREHGDASFVGGGDGLNAPRRVPSKRSDLPRVVPVPEQPVRRRHAAQALVLPLWLLLVAVLLLLLAFLREVGQRPAWDYKITSPHDVLFEIETRAEGADGWEMVSARRAGSESERMRYEIIWKRRR